jgi:hypothetical protein
MFTPAQKPRGFARMICIAETTSVSTVIPSSFGLIVSVSTVRGKPDWRWKGSTGGPSADRQSLAVQGARIEKRTSASSQPEADARRPK